MSYGYWGNVLNELISTDALFVINCSSTCYAIKSIDLKTWNLLFFNCHLLLRVIGPQNHSLSHYRCTDSSRQLFLLFKSGSLSFLRLSVFNIPGSLLLSRVKVNFLISPSVARPIVISKSGLNLTNVLISEQSLLVRYFFSFSVHLFYRLLLVQKLSL